MKIKTADLPFPVEVLNQHLVVLGKTGAGKSYTLRGIVENLLCRGKRVCIVDPKGDWFGVKLSADGASGGFPVVAFGDFKAEKATDIKINAHAGKEIANIVASGNRPCVIGFRGWMPQDRTRFWIDFASGLFNQNSSELYIVIDEVHNFAMQGKVLDPESGKCLHWTNRIASEGRGIGLRVLMASQRPQKVHKDTLTCAETLIAMRVIHPLDRGAIKEWIDGCGDPKHGHEILNTVAFMPRGEGWVWSPEIGFLQRVKFPRIQTFDSFSERTEGAAAPAGWAEIDLDDVRARLSRLVEEAKANDPAELKRKLRTAEQELAALKQKAPEVKRSEPKEIPVLTENERKDLKRMIRSVEHLNNRLLTLDIGVKDLSKTAEQLEKFIAPRLQAAIKEVRQVPSGLPGSVRPSAPPRFDARDALRPEYRGKDNNIGIGRCERAILRALAQFPQGRTTVQIAVLTGYSSNSGGFNNSLGKLRSLGFISRTNPVVLLPGNDLPPYDPLPTGDELVKHWLTKLGKCERMILETLVSVHPEGLSAVELGERTGYSSNSGGFNNALGRLRTLELITRGQPIKASDDFFQ